MIKKGLFCIMLTDEIIEKWKATNEIEVKEVLLVLKEGIEQMMNLVDLALSLDE